MAKASVNTNAKMKRKPVKAGSSYKGHGGLPTAKQQPKNNKPKHKTKPKTTTNTNKQQKTTNGNP